MPRENKILLFSRPARISSWLIKKGAECELGMYAMRRPIKGGGEQKGLGRKGNGEGDE